MNVRVYLTDLPLPAREVHPLAIVPDTREPRLPAHPEGLVWRYSVTTDTRDTLLNPLRRRIEEAIASEGHCLLFEPLDRLLSPLSLNAFRHRYGKLRRKDEHPQGYGKPNAFSAPAAAHTSSCRLTDNPRASGGPRASQPAIGRYQRALEGAHLKDRQQAQEAPRNALSAY